MIDPYFVFLGAALGMIGSSVYAWRTLQGRASPNRVTFFLWSAAPLIGFLAQLDEGVGLPSVLTLAIGVGPALVFLASFFGRAAPWRLTAFDLGCGAVSVVALIIWLSMDNPTVAVIFAVLADLLGGIPTIRKAWRAPQTEDWRFFALSGTNGAITLLTITSWDVATWSFPVYITVVGYGIALIVLVRRPALR